MLNYLAEIMAEVPEEVLIHPSALVYKGAQFGKGVVVGPGAIVGAKVSLGDGVKIGARAIVEGKTTIGAGTFVYPMATIGSDPQDLKYGGEETELIIGKNNRLREYVNISTGTGLGGGKTTLGDNNLIMVFSHIAHDCHIDSNCILANGVHLAGHVRVEDHVVFGGMSGGHQFCRFGQGSMVAAGAIVVQDVPPYCMVQGDRARISGMNVVGLRRSDLPKTRISDIKSMFKILFNENLTVEDALSRIELEVADSDQRQNFIAFLKGSSRGICR